MRRIKLALAESPGVALEVEGLQPTLLAGMSIEEVMSVEVQYGNKRKQVGDFFRVEIIDEDPTPDKGRENDIVLEFSGDLRKVKRIGDSLREGAIVVNGKAGMHLGSYMSGGSITVNGDTGDWAGAHMSGGRLVIKGNTGNFLGSAYWGHKLGMTGGHIIVNGNAGNMAGRLMRRGQITVLGNTGDFTASNMVAGTVLVAGKAGRRTGAEMKRGTILLTKEPELLPTFRFNCVYRPAFVNIITDWLEKEGVRVGHLFANKRYKRYAGDAVIRGKGEILIADLETEPQ